MKSNYSLPVNLGNEEEFTIEEFAYKIRNLVGNSNEIIKLKAVVDDPRQRRPNISVAMREIGWKPMVKVHDGLERTIKYFDNELKKIKFENEDFENLVENIHTEL
jgi:UDP-glucuronate decarboxylase